MNSAKDVEEETPGKDGNKEKRTSVIDEQVYINIKMRRKLKPVRRLSDVKIIIELSSSDTNTKQV